MAKSKSVSNEQIIAALLTKGTQKAAAEYLGVNPKTINDRYNDPDFTELYREAKTEILRNAVSMLNTSLFSAISTVCEVMTDTEVNPAIRLQAAQTIINNSAKYTELLDRAEEKNNDWLGNILNF